jgi:hypothetical protein
MQIARYLVPVSAVASLALVASVSVLTPLLSRIPLAVMALGLALFPGAYSVISLITDGFPVNTGARDAYLTAQLPGYPAFAYLNRTRGASYHLYGLMFERMFYFADGQFLGDHFGPARFRETIALLDDPRALHEHLRGLGCDHFLIRRGFPGKALTETDGFHLLIEGSDWKLFALTQ